MTILELQVSDGGFTARPVRSVARERYTLAKLLRGVTELAADTAWAREGEPVGCERPVSVQLRTWLSSRTVVVQPATG